MLTSSAVFGAWSAWNSSLFTAATFVDNEEKFRNAKLAMDLGIATAVATGLGVYLVYGDKGKFAAISAVLTGAVLYAAYWLKLKSNPKINGFMSGGSKKRSIKSTYNDTNIDTWIPLSDEDIQEIRNIVNSSPIQTVSEL